ncbi:hypothetical protein TNIN_221331 [Trichonephila inaurata madagascariensis]|uniref:Uncharacterized protein n=1 Tax=Trichonephila inaurata madagascariensis TaxID=2747483 RepID=A0A8X6XAE9_9ARAC|nr:hypothetical protein TNIN_221331 [Trichonephila inaurata madagascariensis]
MYEEGEEKKKTCLLEECALIENMSSTLLLNIHLFDIANLLLGPELAFISRLRKADPVITLYHRIYDIYCLMNVSRSLGNVQAKRKIAWRAREGKRERTRTKTCRCRDW